MVTIVGLIFVGASTFVAYAFCKVASESDIDIGGDYDDKRV